MRSRLLAVAAALTLAVAGLLVPASPASAHCGGHNTHPDLYHNGGIKFKEGTRIREAPHTACRILGLGYPSHGIDVHCAAITGSIWFFVRDTSTGIKGWSRVDKLDLPPNGEIDLCNS